MTRRQLMKRTLALGVAGGSGCLGYGATRGRHALAVERIPLALPAQEPFTIATFGDLHFDPLFEGAFFAEIVATTNALRPDMIALLGDFVTSDGRAIDRLAPILGELRAPLGVFAVLGNHDHWNGPGHCRKALRDQGITVLRNEHVTTPVGVTVAGMESAWGGQPDLARTMRGAPTGRPTVLLMHEPDVFDEARQDPRVALQLSGHTHGGQVRLPWIGEILVPHLGEKYIAGLYRRDGAQLYVNRGVGTIGPHARFFCRPEITLIEALPPGTPATNFPVSFAAPASIG